MAVSLWDKCVQQLQSDLPEQHFNTWIRPLQAIEEQRGLRLLAPNRFVVDWVRQHFLERPAPSAEHHADPHRHDPNSGFGGRVGGRFPTAADVGQKPLARRTGLVQLLVAAGTGLSEAPPLLGYRAGSWGPTEANALFGDVQASWSRG